MTAGAAIAVDDASVTARTRRRDIRASYLVASRTVETETSTETFIVGAGPAGLSVAACLRKASRSFEIVDRADAVGSAWRAHYDRLHLHTDKKSSELPFHRFPREYPKYPSREQVVTYLESYAKELAIAPHLGETVTRAERDGDGWRATTSRATYRAKNLVVATGYTCVPQLPDAPGRESFAGEVIHSSQYKTGAAYRGKSALVVGFGNSAGEIAIDLVENGARVQLAVRSAVNVIKREMLGMPVLTIAGMLGWLPPRIADALSWPLVRLTVGDIRKLGLKKLPFGPMRQVTGTGRIPLIDIGTIDLIRKGAIHVRPGIARFDGADVVFTDDTREAFDLVVLATGFRPGVGFVAEPNTIGENGVPTTSGTRAAEGLYYIGFYVSPFGMLRAINEEARAIAKDITS